MADNLFMVQFVDGTFMFLNNEMAISLLHKVDRIFVIPDNTIVSDIMDYVLSGEILLSWRELDVRKIVKNNFHG